MLPCLVTLHAVSAGRSVLGVPVTVVPRVDRQFIMHPTCLTIWGVHACTTVLVHCSKWGCLMQVRAAYC